MGMLKLVFGIAIAVSCLGLALPFESVGQEPEFGETTQMFPQFAVGGGYTTSITIHNPTRQSEVVTVELYQSNGRILSTRTVSLNPSETKIVHIDPPSELTVGWAKLSSQ